MTKHITVAIGADHRGFTLKNMLQASITHHDGIAWLDVGASDDARSDYPVFAAAVCNAIVEEKASYGVLLCGTGVGMSIAANRFKGIYAGLAWNEEIARLGKQDDNVNVLVIPADYVTPQCAVAMVRAWHAASFLSGRYQQRLDLIDSL